MRIIAGQYRGTRLAALGKGDPGAHLRPTPDRVRESQFNVLGAYVDWERCRVLDVFAGTGALGLEALSRGAERAVFVENGRVGGRLLAENIAKLRLEDQTRVLRADATRLGVAPEAGFDLVFMDPPYGKGLGQRAAQALRKGGWFSQDAVLCLEDSASIDALDGFEVLDQRRYGESHVTLMRYRQDG